MEFTRDEIMQLLQSARIVAKVERKAATKGCEGEDYGQSALMRVAVSYETLALRLEALVNSYDAQDFEIAARPGKESKHD